MNVIVSLWIFTCESVLECPVLERLSWAPRDRARTRDRATPVPHGSTVLSVKERAPTPNSTSGRRGKGAVPDARFLRRNSNDSFFCPSIGTGCFTPLHAGDGAHKGIGRGKLGPDRIGGELVTSAALHIRKRVACTSFFDLLLLHVFLVSFSFRLFLSFCFSFLSLFVFSVLHFVWVAGVCACRIEYHGMKLQVYSSLHYIFVVSLS